MCLMKIDDMQKIMFNDKYGLTNAVLQGRKTMTRRLVGNRMTEDDIKAYFKGYTELANKCAQYKKGEEAAVAQCYRTIYTGPGREFGSSSNNSLGLMMTKGWVNKMFVRADLMPHKIRFIDIKIERLQDISDEDCLREGVLYSDKYAMPYGISNVPTPNGVFFYYSSPREAFAALIDAVSGKGKWESNPWVFVCSFELVKPQQSD